MTDMRNGDFCHPCGHDHPPIDHLGELFLPWSVVDCEVIDRDADIVAKFENPHDAWLVVQRMNTLERLP